MLIDTIHFGIKSLQGNNVTKLYGIQYGFNKSYKKTDENNENIDKVPKMFVKEYGAPNLLILDNRSTQKGEHTSFQR